MNSVAMAQKLMLEFDPGLGFLLRVPARRRSSRNSSLRVSVADRRGLAPGTSLEAVKSFWSRYCPRFVTPQWM